MFLSSMNSVGTAQLTLKFMPKDFTLEARRILLFSPVHKSEMINTGEVNLRGKIIMKPMAIIEYNDGKKGVELGH